jgi:hypothetical protein
MKLIYKERRGLVKYIYGQCWVLPPACMQYRTRLRNLPYPYYRGFRIIWSAR